MPENGGMTGTMRGLLVLSLFLVFFGALFLQFPLTDSLPGNCDTMIVIAMTDHYLERAVSSFSDVFFGTAMYPVEDPVAYGESSPGTRLVFSFFRLLGADVHWAYYFYTVLLCALNGFALYLLGGVFLRTVRGRILAGFLFSCSNMVFAHIDDVIIIFYAPVFLSLLYVLRWDVSRRTRLLIAGGVLLGLEVYFSFYVFLYGSVITALTFIFFIFRKRISVQRGSLTVLLFFSVSAVFAVPQVLYHLNTLDSFQFLTPFDPMYTTKMTSFNPVDMLLALPGNIPYGWIANTPVMNWGFVRHYNFIAPGTLLAAGYTLWRFRTYRPLFVLWIVAGLLLAAGPYFMAGMKTVMPSPLLVFYTHIPILRFLRVTSRAYFIVLFAVSIAAAVTVEHLLGRIRSVRWRHGFMTTVVLLHFFESVPLPLHAFDLPPSYPKSSYEFIRSRNQSAVIVDLPSVLSVEYDGDDIGLLSRAEDYVKSDGAGPPFLIDNYGMFVHSWDNLFEYNRELVYVWWQVQHGMNTVNGVNGYFPVPRMLFQYHIDRLPDPNAIRWLVANDVSFFVFHSDMTIRRDTLSVEDLVSSPCLREIRRDGRTVVFEPTGSCSDGG